MITTVSRREAQGGTKELAFSAVAGTTLTTAAAAGLALGRSRTAGGKIRRVVALGLLGAHAASMARVELKAVQRPSAKNLQRVVGAGVLGLMPLEGGMLAGAGAVGKAVALAAGWRVARRLAQKRSVT